MSTYTQLTKNPKTNKFEPAEWIDDYFGRHRYGVKFPDGDIYNPDLMDLETKDWETKDSGERVEFESGMVRDTESGKPNFSLCLPKDLNYDQQMLTRWAALMTRGAEKYSKRNWEQASGEEELERFKASAFRHFVQWISGEEDEDHAAAVFFNITGAEYVKEKI